MENNISTYKGLLVTIQRFEKDEDKFRKERFVWCMAFFFVSTAIIIGYAICKRSIEVFVSTDLIGAVLIPLFIYLFASYEKDYINQRRSDIISSIIQNFRDDKIDMPSFGDGPIRFDELKNIIYNILNNKL